MTLTKERSTTELLPPRSAPLKKQEARGAPPPIEPTRRGPQPVRWLPWMAGLILIIALGAFAAIQVAGGDGDDVAETPGQGTELTTPSLADIDLHENPEIVAAYRGHLRGL